MRNGPFQWTQNGPFCRTLNGPFRRTLIGDNTWGARTHDEYLLSNDKNHHLTIAFKGK